MARVLGLVLSGLYSVLSVIVDGGGHYDRCKRGNWPAIAQIYIRAHPPPSTGLTTVSRARVGVRVRPDSDLTPGPDVCRARK